MVRQKPLMDAEPALLVRIALDLPAEDSFWDSEECAVLQARMSRLLPPGRLVSADQESDLHRIVVVGVTREELLHIRSEGPTSWLRSTHFGISSARGGVMPPVYVEGCCHSLCGDVRQAVTRRWFGFPSQGALRLATGSSRREGTSSSSSSRTTLRFLRASLYFGAWCSPDDFAPPPAAPPSPSLTAAWRALIQTSLDVSSPMNDALPTEVASDAVRRRMNVRVSAQLCLAALEAADTHSSQRFNSGDCSGLPTLDELHRQGSLALLGHCITEAQPGASPSRNSLSPRQLSLVNVVARRSMPDVMALEVDTSLRVRSRLVEHPPFAPYRSPLQTSHSKRLQMPFTWGEDQALMRALPHAMLLCTTRPRQISTDPNEGDGGGRPPERQQGQERPQFNVDARVLAAELSRRVGTRTQEECVRRCMELTENENTSLLQQQNATAHAFFGGVSPIPEAPTSTLSRRGQQLLRLASLMASTGAPTMSEETGNLTSHQAALIGAPDTLPCAIAHGMLLTERIKCGVIDRAMRCVIAAAALKRRTELQDRLRESVA